MDHAENGHLDAPRPTYDRAASPLSAVRDDPRRTAAHAGREPAGHFTPPPSQSALHVSARNVAGMQRPVFERSSSMPGVARSDARSPPPVNQPGAPFQARGSVPSAWEPSDPRPTVSHAPASSAGMDQYGVAAAPPPMRAAAAHRPSDASDSAHPSLHAVHVQLPDAASLREQRVRVRAAGSDVDMLHWSTQVLKYMERMHASNTAVPDEVMQWVEEAILQIIQCASHPEATAEALYARGDLLASGAFPAYVAKDLRSAFSDFERSARMGWAPSWSRVGRDYETLGDVQRAYTAYERGVALNDVGSMYRMGMAYLLGQLQVRVNVGEGVALLTRAADAATVDAPHPAYVYGLLLAGELSNVNVPLEFLAGAVRVRQRTRAALLPHAREYLVRAAYLNLPAAQYKCGWCYEHAQLSFPFDPLLSVQYYSAASQGGEPDADMALSKWFLCGADGCFEKNEGLAWTFAERAVKHQLPTAEFAMGYYLEVGIGTPINLDAAKAWYTKAAAQGNTDATERLAALQHSDQVALSRAQHQRNLDAKLYAKHSLARTRSQALGAGGAPSGARHRSELARKNTMNMVDANARREPARGRARPPGAAPRPVQYGDGTAPAPSAGGADARGAEPTKKVYNSFSDMGFQPKTDRDCTVM
ncbi:hypothetical protein MSPP1_002433 [Malassezia sp. CBS 17886]|nr:hypothetical protein MSPP1_002433 [Malassezia sp. CBS 17886]